MLSGDKVNAISFIDDNFAFLDIDLLTKWNADTNYLRQAGYEIVTVRLLATLCKNVWTDLHEIFQGRLAMDQWTSD